MAISSGSWLVDLSNSLVLYTTSCFFILYFVFLHPGPAHHQTFALRPDHQGHPREQTPGYRPDRYKVLVFVLSADGTTVAGGAISAGEARYESPFMQAQPAGRVGGGYFGGKATDRSLPSAFGPVGF